MSCPVGHTWPPAPVRTPTRVAARCGLGGADHSENLAAFRDGPGHRPGEHFRVALVHTPGTEVVKRGPAGIRHKDLGDPRGDAVAHQLVQGVHEFLPKADVRPHDELECRELLGREVRKGALPSRDVDPVALGVQLEIRKHRRVGVEPRHLGLERFGTGDAHQPPAAAELQHASLGGDTTLVEIVHQDKTGRPDLVPMEGGPRGVVLSAAYLRMAGVQDREPIRLAFLRGCAPLRPCRHA